MLLKKTGAQKGKMSKLDKLKPWLTVADAARRLSISFGEEVTEADILRLALDGQLRLSVHLVNHAIARCGFVIPWVETDWQVTPNSNRNDIAPDQVNNPKSFLGKISPLPKKLLELYADIPIAQRKNYVATMLSLNIDDERFLTLSDETETLRGGVWDLPMIGNERFTVEQLYQALVGSVEVKLFNLNGAFVEGIDGKLCQLQENLEEEASPDIPDRNCGRDAFKTFLNKATSYRGPSYFPAAGLPKDSQLVVRTEVLSQFEQNSDDTSSLPKHPNVSDQLRLMMLASTCFWGRADRDDRSTHPTNAGVAAWLKDRGFTPSLAKSAATIIRPVWAPKGRKPEE